jgi:hypothetical protein
MTHYAIGAPFGLDYFLPHEYSITPAYGTYNFAHISFDWGVDRLSSKASINVKGIDNNDLIKMELKYTDLTYNATRITEPNCSALINRRFKTFEEYIDYYRSNPLQLYVFPVYLLAVVLLLSLFLLPFIVLRCIYRYCRKKISQPHVKNE